MSTRKSINGEMLTIDEAWNKHKNLCWKYVRANMSRARRMGYTLADVEQVAAAAFTQAYNDFDPEKGYKFSTYAIPIIFGVMDNEFVRKNSGFNFTIPIKKMAFKFLKEFRPEKREDTKLDDIMNHLQIDYFKAYEVFQFIHNELLYSMDKPAKIDGETSDRWEAVGTEADYSTIQVEEIKSLCTEKENEVINLILSGVDRRDIHRFIGVVPSAVFARVQKIKKRMKKAGIHDGQAI
ncbi:sigma factor [Priestia aryabhattai]|uniref:sigma factor n=1 Tax=Priestia aryabhattai TaxID=412384 RepID=UPI0039A1FE00